MVLKVTITKPVYSWQYYESCFQYFIRDLTISVCKRDDAIMAYGNYNKIVFVISRKPTTNIDICNLLSSVHSYCQNKINLLIKEKIKEMKDILLMSEECPTDELEKHNASLIYYLEHITNHVDLNVRVYNIDNGDIIPYIMSTQQEMTNANRIRLQSYYNDIGRSDFDVMVEMEKSEKFKTMMTGCLFKRDKTRVEKMNLEVKENYET